MIGRTNIIFGSGSSSGGSGGVTTVDLPTCPSSLTASPANGKVTLALTYSDTDFVSGVEVRYKTGSYPTSPTDGTGKTVTSAATSIEVTGLTNGTTYYFRVYLYREIDSVKYYQTDETNAKIESAPMVGVTVSGITPAIQTDSYLIIDTSGSFTMTIPEGKNVTAYIVGGGCQGETAGTTKGGAGGYGGWVYSTELSALNNVQCTCSIGSASTNYSIPTTSSLNIDGTSYKATSGARLEGGSGAASSNATAGTTGTSTPYGYVGSSGGGGGYNNYDSKVGSNASGGSGAGYGGAAGKNGYNAVNYGCGGGGGGYLKTVGDSGMVENYGTGGAGKKGCIIIAWT